MTEECLPLNEKAQRRGGFALLLAVAVGRPVAECAALGGVSEATVRRRMRSPKFMTRVRQLQRQMIAHASGKIVSALGQALDAMIALLSSANDSVRLGAASRIVQLSTQLGELSDLQDKVGKLESLIQQLRQEKSRDETGSKD